MERQEKGSNFYMLTAQILNDKNLNSSEKIVMSILFGLSDEDGRCFPSNGWIAKKLEMTERGVQKILENLQNNNYIFREIISSSANPMKKYRIIHVRTDFKVKESDIKKLNRDEQEFMFEHEQKFVTDTNKSSHIINKKELIEDRSQKLATGKSPPAPPPPSGHYKEKFEGKICITEENFGRLLEKFGSEELLDSYAEKLYRWSFNNEKAFKIKKRHDMVLEDWIEKDRKAAPAQKPQEGTLNALQQANWLLNQEVVQELKIHGKGIGLNWFYKHHVLKDKNDPSFDVSGLINHKDFCILLEKHLKCHIVRERFPNG